MYTIGNTWHLPDVYPLHMYAKMYMYEVMIFKHLKSTLPACVYTYGLDQVMMKILMQGRVNAIIAHMVYQIVYYWLCLLYDYVQIIVFVKQKFWKYCVTYNVF